MLRNANKAYFDKITNGAKSLNQFVGQNFQYLGDNQRDWMRFSKDTRTLHSYTVEYWGKLTNEQWKYWRLGSEDDVWELLKNSEPQVLKGGKTFKELAKEYNADPKTREHAADCYYKSYLKLEDTEECVEQLEHIVRTHASSTECRTKALLILADIELGRHELEAAVGHLRFLNEEKLEDKDGNNKKSWFEEVLVDLTKIFLKENRPNPELSHMLGQLWKNKGTLISKLYEGVPITDQNSSLPLLLARLYDFRSLLFLAEQKDKEVTATQATTYYHLALEHCPKSLSSEKPAVLAAVAKIAQESKSPDKEFAAFVYCNHSGFDLTKPEVEAHLEQAALFSNFNLKPVPPFGAETLQPKPVNFDFEGYQKAIRVRGTHIYEAGSGFKLLAEKSKDAHFSAHCHIKYGDICVEEKRIDLAIKHYFKAYELMAAQNPARHVAKPIAKFCGLLNAIQDEKLIKDYAQKLLQCYKQEIAKSAEYKQIEEILFPLLQRNIQADWVHEALLDLVDIKAIAEAKQDSQAAKPVLALCKQLPDKKEQSKELPKDKKEHAIVKYGKKLLECYLAELANPSKQLEAELFNLLRENSKDAWVYDVLIELAASNKKALLEKILKDLEVPNSIKFNIYERLAKPELSKGVENIHYRLQAFQMACELKDKKQQMRARNAFIKSMENGRDIYVEANAQAQAQAQEMKESISSAFTRLAEEKEEIHALLLLAEFKRHNGNTMKQSITHLAVAFQRMATQNQYQFIEFALGIVSEVLKQVSNSDFLEHELKGLQQALFSLRPTEPAQLVLLNQFATQQKNPELTKHSVYLMLQQPIASIPEMLKRCESFVGDGALKPYVNQLNEIARNPKISSKHKDFVYFGSAHDLKDVLFRVEMREVIANLINKSTIPFVFSQDDKLKMIKVHADRDVLLALDYCIKNNNAKIVSADEYQRYCFRVIHLTENVSSAMEQYQLSSENILEIRKNASRVLQMSDNRLIVGREAASRSTYSQVRQLGLSVDYERRTSAVQPVGGSGSLDRKDNVAVPPRPAQAPAAVPAPAAAQPRAATSRSVARSSV